MTLRGPGGVDTAGMVRPLDTRSERPVRTPMGKTAALIILAIGLAIGLPLSALAQNDVFIVPAVPTSQTAVTLHVTGGSASACPPTNANFAILGNHDIVVTLNLSPYSS